MKKIPDFILSILLGIIVIITFNQVIYRYLLNSSLSWSEELTRYLFVWFTFLGAAICIRDRLHIGVDFIYSRVSVEVKSFLEKFNVILMSAFNLSLSITGFMWVVETSGSISPAMGLPLNLIFYSALPMTTLLGFIYGVADLTKNSPQ